VETVVIRQELPETLATTAGTELYPNEKLVDNRPRRDPPAQTAPDGLETQKDGTYENR
jgi:hypothetical protein